MKPRARLRLTLLGGFEAQLDSGAGLVLPTRKAQALVAYLALPPGRAHQREKLATLLWGDMADAQARGNLRHAISRIRKALPETARTGILLDGPTVALQSSTVDVDVARFERLIADGSPGALEQIPDVYRGDLLAGLALAERPFDEWLISERERLHELAIQGLNRLLVEQQQAGAIEPAVQTGLRLLALDDLQEPVHRTIMRLYARLGRREAALRQYRLCVDALRRELHAEPEAETHHLYEEILRSRPIRGERATGSRPAGAPPVPAPVAGVASGAAAILAATPPSTNLPASTSELIGRDVALEEVTELLEDHRLVTLTGAGGIGKTRLGLEVASQMLPRFTDGVWVAELAPLSDPRLVPVTVAVALGLTLRSGAPEQVAAALGAKRLLLVLDSCEHVIEAAARMAEALLRANPHARILATSREPLRAPGECVYRVPPLQVPGTEGREDPLATAAVKLFVARARAVDLRFSLDTRGAAIAGAICRRLDGIPLAIELAAARTATLGVDALAARLDDRFRLLTGGYRTALPRQQTLRATLDWSYELLSDVERVVMRRLAVFAGAFSLDAAMSVVAHGALTPSDVMDGVSSLVDRSLVGAHGGATVQYRVLETTRAYAREKLRESGEGERVLRRHAEHLRDVFERAQPGWETRPTSECLAAYSPLLDDVRAALDWAFSTGGDLEPGVRLAIAAAPLWFELSLLEECLGWMERARARVAPGALPQPLEMKLSAALALSLQDTRGAGAVTETVWAQTLAIAERLGDDEYRVRALWGLFSCRNELALARQIAAIAATRPDGDLRAIADRLIGSSLHYLGDQVSARRLLEQMLTGYSGVTTAHSQRIRFIYDQRVVAQEHLAHVLWLQGWPEQARRFAAAALAHARAGVHPPTLCLALGEAEYAHALYTGDLETMERAVSELLDVATRYASAAWQAAGRCMRGLLLVKRGDAGAYARLVRPALDELGESRYFFHYTGFLAALADGLGRAGVVAEGRALLEAAFARCTITREGWSMPELLRVKGELLLRDGATDGAEEHFRRALDDARARDLAGWELRAATSLARLWHRRGRVGPARELLAPIYRRFTEGFDTTDLRAAEALLADLG